MSALLLEAVLKSSLVVGAAAVADMLLRRTASAAIRHLVWTIAVGGLLVLPVLLIAIPRWELRVPTPSSAPAPSYETTLPNAVPSDAGHNDRSVDVGRSNAPAAPFTVRATAASEPGHYDFLAWVYGAGVVLLFVRLALQQRAARRLVSAATPVAGAEWSAVLHECVERLDVRGPVRLHRSRQQTVPMTFGTRVPTVLVPAAADTWSNERRKAVLLHELGHIVRRDCATQMAAAAACAVYWFHPAVWWAASRMRHEREIACDDLVLSAGTQPADYAGHLLELAYTCVGTGTPALTVTMARPSEIEGRLRAILDAARNRGTPARRTRLWILAVALAAIGVVAAARATLVPVQAQSDQSAGNLLAAPPQPPAHSSQIDNGARAIADGRSGTWQLWASEDGIVRVRLSDRDGSWYSLDDDTRVEAQWNFSSERTLGTMTVTRDAGTFTLEGVWKLGPGSRKAGVGAGTFTFAPSATFPAELARRGYARPTALEQYLLARSNIGFTFIDELSKQGYARPDLATLVRASEHGVSLSQLRAMGQFGYRMQQVDALITLVDHGVSANFVRELRDLGFRDLTADDLVRTRDHGVDAVYIKELRALGYDVPAVENAIRTRDHGVDVDYVRGLRQLGYRPTLEDIVTARDHGIDLDYIRDLSRFGYANLRMEQMIRTRDHGVDAGYIRELRQLGYQTSLESLINARDHGVDPEYIRALAAQGYKGLSLEQLIRLRDHGIDPGFVEQVKKSGFMSATPEDLVRLRDTGPITNRVVDTLRGELSQWTARLAQWRGRLAR